MIKVLYLVHKVFIGMTLIKTLYAHMAVMDSIYSQKRKRYRRS
nr:MAG TPA: hypothetical protein [Bacteriophage sp.]